MARNHAFIYTSIWTDDDFVRLPESVQRLYFLLLSQPDLNLCGVTTVRPKVWVRLAPDSTSARTFRNLAALTAAGFVLFDNATDEVAIRSFIRYEKILKSPNTFKGMCRSFGTVHSRPIRAAIVQLIPCHMREGFPDDYVDAQPKALGELLKEPFPEPLQERLPEPIGNGVGKGPARARLSQVTGHREKI